MPSRQESVKGAKQTSSAAKSQYVKASTGLTVSDTLRQLSGTQTASQVRESRRTLQAGEAVLAEVQDSLSRMDELAKKAAEEGGDIDREALQAELERLQEGIERMVSRAMSSGVQMFADDILEPSDWLTQGILENAFSADQLLAELGLGQSATGAELLAAIANHPADENTATAYLASLYLGAVVAANGTENLDPSQALDGLRQLMEKVADGMTVDEAIKELTDGMFTSLEDFQTQFANGEAPGMEDFLSNVLLSNAGAGALVMPNLSLLDFLSGMEGMNFDILMTLLAAAQSGEMTPELELAADADSSTAAASTTDTAAANAPEPAAEQTASVQMGNVEVRGADLSGVSYNASTGVVTVAGSADVTIRGLNQEPQALQITGSGTVTLENITASAVAVDAPEAHIDSAGINRLGQVQLREGVTLTLGGSGHLEVASFRGNDSNSIHMRSGALAIPGKNGEILGKLTIPVIMEAPAVLAAQAVSVRSAEGKTMEPLDIVWKALFPGFGEISALGLDGKHAKMLMMNGQHSDLVRLWLEKGDLSKHGNPLYALTVQGKDEAGQTKTRYTYLYWNHQKQNYEEVSMYPNPFTVTGGEAGRDWIYEETTQTLRILSGQVLTIAGGEGTDAHQEPFSGRIALADSIGAVELALGGVVCRVTSGWAFHLGCGNDVTLLLESGSQNLFESGTGCAGISLGEGTSLRIDSLRGKGPAGTLTANGGKGGSGIGRDAGSTAAIGPILLRGGANLGAGALGEMQSLTIAGGSVTANGGKKRTSPKKRWVQRSVSLQMGEYTAILPQFRLSSKVLQLNKLRVSTREYARAAMMTIDEDRRWVSQIQSAYSTLYGQLDSPVRDSVSASSLLKDVSQSIPPQSPQTMRTPGERENVRHLLW